MDRVDVNSTIIIAAIIIVISLALLGILLDRQLKNDCVKTVKDKPAIEIQAICK